MDTVARPAVTAAGPLPPHPAEHMTPPQYARWLAELEYWAARRGLAPEPH